MMNRRLRLCVAALIATGGTAAAAIAADAPAIATPVTATPAITTAAGTAATTAATAATTAATDVAARRGRARAATYTWARVAPAKLPDGTPMSYSSKAVGIDDAGRVAGDVDVIGEDGRDLPFVGEGRSARWLDVAGLETNRWVTAVSPKGVVLGGQGGVRDSFLSWAPDGRRSFVATPESHYGPFARAINSSGTVAGVLSSVKVGTPFYGRPGALAQVPMTKFGNLDVTGISEAGQAVGTLRAPSYQHQDRYPEGILFTAAGVKSVRANDTTAIDAISPNGRYVVGRVGAGNFDQPLGRAAWLSTSRHPDTLRSASGFRPADVSDRGVVVGSWRGHAAVWQNGSLVDLNTRVRGLPARWVLTDVVAINASGALAVNAKDGSGNAVALKLTQR